MDPRARIPEQTALNLWRGRDQLDPAGQAEAADIYERYIKQQDNLGEPLWPSVQAQQAEARAKLNSMFKGLDAVPFQPSPWLEKPDEAKAMHASLAFLSNRLNLPADQIAQRSDHYMNGYASQKWGKATANPLEFYAGASQEIAKEEADDSTRQAGYAAALRGEDSAKALAEFQIKNAGNWQDMLRNSSLFTRAYMQGQDYAGDKLPLAKELIGIIEGDASKTTGDGQQRSTPAGREQSARMTEIVQQMATMTKGERKRVYASIGAQIEAAGYDQKGFWAQTLSNLGRNVAGIGERVNTKAIEAGLAVAAAPMSPGSEFGDVPEIDPNAERDMLAASKLNDDMSMVRDEISQIVAGKLDPIKPTVGWLNDSLEKGLIQAPGSVAPYAMATAALGPWGAGIIATADFSEANRLELINQGLAPDDAKRIGAAAAPFQAAVESLSNMVQLGRFPAVQKALAGLTKPITGGAGMMARYGLNAGVSLTTEFTEEQLQDNVIVPMAQNVVAAFDKDVPTVGMGQIWESIKKDSPDLFFTLAPMALVFGGMMTSAQASLSEQLTSNIDALSALGFNQAQATQINQEASPEAKISKARELWGVRAGTPLTMNEAAKLLTETMRKFSVDAVAAQQELERRGVLPRMLHTAQDTWRLTFNDGSVTDFATHAEADQSRWAWASDQLGKFHAVTRQALVSLEKNLEQNREIAPIYSPDVKVITKEDAAANPDLQERLDQAENLGDVQKSYDDTLSIGKATGTDDNVLAQILGSSTNSFKDGILTTTIKLYEGSNVLTLVEEKLEGDAKAMMGNAKSRAWMVQHLQDYERESGDKLFHTDEISDKMLAEAWSHLGQSYLVGRSTYGDPLQGGAYRRFLRYIMQSGLSGAMNAQAEYWRAVATRGQKLIDLKSQGKLKDDLVTELERQLGIDNSQARHEQGWLKEAESIAKEGGNGTIPVATDVATDETLSIRKGDFDSRLAAMFSPFQKSPQLRMQIAQVAKQRAQRLGAEWIEKAAEIRSASSIEREAKTREAFKTAELMQAGAEEKAARKEAKAEAAAWASEARKKAGSPKAQRENLQGALRTLDAILSAAPPEVRARVGGYVKLAGLATDEAMLKEIERRVEKLNVELEKWLKKEGVAQIEKLFRKAGPKAESGKKAKGKDADMHHLFAVAEKAAEMDALTVAGKLAELDTRITSGELADEQEALAKTERGIIELVGDLKNADSGRVFSALATLEDIYQGGWLKWKLKEIEKRERRAGARQDFITATGKAGLAKERDAAQEHAQTLLGKIKAGFLSLSSFHEVLAYAFGEKSPLVKGLVDAERAASGQYEDANQAVADELETLFTQLGGSVLAGEKLRFDMSQPTIKTAQKDLSQLQAIQALLMFAQEDGRRHMEGTRNENGDITSAWSYDEAWIQEVEKQLTPEARKVMAWIQAKYGSEWATLDPLYSDRYGVHLPHHDNYAPLTVKPVQTAAGEVVDPVSGAAIASGSILTPGSLRTRSRSAIAEPEFRDALQTFLLHTRQLEYWKAYYSLATEANAILGNREVLNAVEAKGGKEASSMLRKWVDAIAQGGFRDASAGLAMSQGMGRMMGRAATVGLLGRFSTLMVQSTQIAAASVKMPVGAYLVRLSKLLAGQMEWGAAIKSPFIQRRYNSAPPIVRQAMEGLGAAKKPNQIKSATRALGQLISGADALFTAGTYAMLYDYHLSTGKALGLSGAELEAHAHTEAERDTEQVAQPTRMAARSMMEITNTSPLGKVGWAYASEARQKIALAAWAATHATTDPARFAKTLFLVFGVGGLMSQVLKNLWREAKGDDDERMWSPERLTMATLSPAPQAIPFLGMLFGDANMFGDVSSRIKTIDFKGDPVDLMKDVDTILSITGLFFDTPAAMATLSHAGLDAAKVVRNLSE